MNGDRAPRQGTESSDLTWLLLRTLGRRIVLIGAVALVVGIAAVALSYLIQPQFTATVTLLPQTGTSSTGLMAAIGNFANIPLPGGEQNLEALYPVIVRSNRLLDGIITESWTYRGETRSLYDVFGVDRAAGHDSLDATRRLKKQLREQVLAFRQDKQVGVMELSVTAPRDPAFAAELANALTDSLGRFTVAFNASKADANLDYVQRRLDEVAVELQAAESDRTRFLEDNRAYASSPRLMQAAGELERQVQALTAVWVELIKQLEIAKLDDDKERFSLEVLDRAMPPLHKSRPKRASMGIIGCLLGGLAASLFVLGRAVVDRQQPAP